jgi:hypothetical protein
LASNAFGIGILHGAGSLLHHLVESHWKVQIIGDILSARFHLFFGIILNIAALKYMERIGVDIFRLRLQGRGKAMCCWEFQREKNAQCSCNCELH